MADREKVIKGLETCSDVYYGADGACSSCPYSQTNGDRCLAELVHDAIDLLKEQEAVAPVMVPHSRGIAWNCGCCGTEIDVVRDTVSADAIPKMHLYCQMCGGKIKW